MNVAATGVVCRQEPLASVHDVRHKVIAMDLDERRKLLITVGRDRIVKVSSFLWVFCMYNRQITCRLVVCLFFNVN